jgi:hypothetical protein
MLQVMALSRAAVSASLPLLWLVRKISPSRPSSNREIVATYASPAHSRLNVSLPRRSGRRRRIASVMTVPIVGDQTKALRLGECFADSAREFGEARDGDCKAFFGGLHRAVFGRVVFANVEKRTALKFGKLNADSFAAAVGPKLRDDDGLGE